MTVPNLDHPSLPLIKEHFPGLKLFATEFRGQTTLVVSREHVADVLRFLRDGPRCRYDFYPTS